MTTPDITSWLRAWQAGDEAAADQLMPEVYGELRRLAQHYMDDEREGHTLSATALVHEAYVKMVGIELPWEGRGHFFAMAARVMRRILIDSGRRRLADKRGGGDVTVSLDGVEAALELSTELLDLDDALTRLAAFDDRRAKILEMRFFGGLKLKEIAAVLDISSATVERDLKLAKAWLIRELGPGRPGR
ncbi:MAG: sigma-70 family RNA polymerase sigma factor [Acidobacteriota bacterium]